MSQHQAPTVRLLDERRFDPPRPVLVEHHGRWWSGFQSSWRLCHDGRGWLAQVEFSAAYDEEPRKHLALVPTELDLI